MLHSSAIVPKEIIIFSLILKLCKEQLRRDGKNLKKKRKNHDDHLCFTLHACTQCQPTSFIFLHYDIPQIILLLKFKPIIAISLLYFF